MPNKPKYNLQNTGNRKGLPQRRSIRLKGYDYSQAGMYFITICCQDRICRFGNVKYGEMVLNDAGCMVDKWYREIENKYPDKKCREMVVMPNHFHCIIENMELSGDAHLDAHGGTSLRGRPETGHNQTPPYGPDNKQYGATIGNAIGWFKTMTTNTYIRGVKSFGWEPFNGKLWQRNYYEHIIRNERAYQNIMNYIINNPAKWEKDKFHP